VRRGQSPDPESGTLFSYCTVNFACNFARGHSEYAEKAAGLLHLETLVRNTSPHPPLGGIHPRMAVGPKGCQAPGLFSFVLIVQITNKLRIVLSTGWAKKPDHFKSV